MKFADTIDRYRISDDFEFRPDRMSNVSVNCPWMLNFFHIYIYIVNKEVEVGYFIIC